MRGKVILILLLMIPFFASAQTRSELKGPDRKNYKVWKNKQNPGLVYTYIQTTLKGPDAKNKRLFKSRKGQGTSLVTRTDRQNRKGPWAKNYKPWKKD